MVGISLKHERKSQAVCGVNFLYDKIYNCVISANLAYYNIIVIYLVDILMHIHMYDYYMTLANNSAEVVQKSSK